MSSKAFINCMATIAIAESQINVLMQQLPPDDLDMIRPALLDVKVACNYAYGCWTGQIDRKGMKRLNGILERFQSSVQSLEMAEFTSTALALLESLRSKLVIMRADRTRINAVTNLIEKFYAVHDFFDPDGDMLAEYQMAAGLERRWSELMEAAA